MARQTPIIASSATATTSGSTAASIAVSKPSGVAAGDLLVVVCATDHIQTTEQITGIPSGFEERFNLWDPSGVEDCQMVVATRVADGSEASTASFTFASSIRAVAAYYRVTGVDAKNAVLHFASRLRKRTAGTLYDIPNASSPRRANLVMGFLAFDGGDGAPFTWPSLDGWTEETSIESAATAATGVQLSVATTPALEFPGLFGGSQVTGSANDGAVMGTLTIAASPFVPYLPARLRRRALWLLDFDIGAEPLRYATEAAELPSRLFGTAVYDSGLSAIDFELEKESASVQVQAATEDKWGIERRRYGPIQGRNFVLRRWYEGQDVEDAVVVLQGIVKKATYGNVRNPAVLSLTLSRALFDVSGIAPTEAMVIDNKTFDKTNLFTNSEDSYGRTYPLVIGLPGAEGSGIDRNADPRPAVPCYVVDAPSTANGTTWRVMVCGHESDVGAVRFFYGGGNAIESVFFDEDDRGRRYGYINIAIGTSGAQIPIEQLEDGIYTGWTFEHTGGIVGGYGVKYDGLPVEGLGDLLLWGAREWLPTVKVDYARLQAQRDQLNRFQLDFSINERVNWVQFLEQNFYDVFDIEEVHGPRGVYWREVIYEADASRVRAVLNTDPAGGGHWVERTSAIADSKETVHNQVSIEFGPYVDGNDFRERRVYGPDDFQIVGGNAVLGAQGGDANTDARLIPNAVCRASFSIYGLRPKTFPLWTTWSAATAFELGRKKVAKHALPAQIVTYRGGPELADLDVYDTIELRDTKDGASFPAGTLALVWSKVLEDEGTFQLTLRVPWDLLRNPITT